MNFKQHLVLAPKLQNNKSILGKSMIFGNPTFTNRPLGQQVLVELLATCILPDIARWRFGLFGIYWQTQRLATAVIVTTPL